MHRDDKSLFLLYIEPKKEERSEYPVDDMLTVAMEIAIDYGITGTGNYSNVTNTPRFQHGGGWMGWHTTDCGQWSDTRDILLRSGHITNSVAPFYLRWYRDSIGDNDMIKMAGVLDTHIMDIPFDRDEVYAKIKELRKYKERKLILDDSERTDVDASLNGIFDFIENTLTVNEDYVLVDTIFQGINCGKWCESELIGFLTITLPFKDKLSKRDSFFYTLQYELEKKYDRKEVDQILSGLK